MSPELLGLLGGSGLLVYSMGELSKSIEYLAGAKFRVWINTYGDNRFVGVFLGLALSLLLSSSSAVTVMLVGLANARLLTLEQVFAMTLGAAVGTTFIVHLLAFRISEYGLGIVFLGVVLEVFLTSDRMKRVGTSLVHVGLMFFALSLVGEAGHRLQENALFRFTVEYFRNRPVVSLLIATGLTAVIQSSAATIAFVMSLMVTEHGTLTEAMPWVLGANLGTTATAFFHSLRSGVLGRQAALGNLLSKTVGVGLCFPLMEYLVRLTAWFTTDLSRQIAWAHTFFNIGIAFLLLPFIKWGVRAVRQIIPTGKENGPFHFQYLDPHSLSLPELALAQAQREILRLSDTVEEMLTRCVLLFKTRDPQAVDMIREMDKLIDFLNKGIKLYLTKLSQQEMSPKQLHKEFEFLLRTNDLENIGDIVDKSIMDLVQKNMKKGYVFSNEGWGEIISFHALVVECLGLSTAYFNSRDEALLNRLTQSYQQIEAMMFQLSKMHVQRLHQGVKESVDTTSVHLDLLGHLQRIAALSVNFTKLNEATEAAVFPQPASA